jgi:hypothetical protein
MRVTRRHVKFGASWRRGGCPRRGAVVVLAAGTGEGRGTPTPTTPLLLVKMMRPCRSYRGSRLYCGMARLLIAESQERGVSSIKA